MRLSVIIPILDEAETLPQTLGTLQALRSEGNEVIVVDGGSRDGSAQLAAGLADQILLAPRGRALQMNAGARRARGECLLFLHADTLLPAGAAETIAAGLAATGRAWGRFDVRLSGRPWPLRLVETLMNLRSRLTGIATGDQALFVKRAVFEKLGGFPEIPLMEDIALCRRLKRISPPLCLRQRVITSSRRWESNGIWRTIALMWHLRLAYFLGADPADLARRYRAGKRS